LRWLVKQTGIAISINSRRRCGVECDVERRIMICTRGHASPAGHAMLACGSEALMLWLSLLDAGDAWGAR
jgi:hypothetical protein